MDAPRGGRRGCSIRVHELPGRAVRTKPECILTEIYRMAVYKTGT